MFLGFVFVVLVFVWLGVMVRSGWNVRVVLNLNLRMCISARDMGDMHMAHRFVPIATAYSYCTLHCHWGGVFVYMRHWAPHATLWDIQSLVRLLWSMHGGWGLLTRVDLDVVVARTSGFVFWPLCAW